MEATETRKSTEATGEDLLAMAITEAFGERCPDFDADCFCCRAWARYDALTAAPAMTTSPDARPLVPDEAVERIARLKAAAHYAERLGKDQTDPHVQMNVDANWPGFADDVRFTLTAALPHMGGAVAIKPLEWEEYWDGHNDDIPAWRGRNPLGMYITVCFSGKYELARHADAPADELAARKAAAQADYETRIRSALVASPAPAVTEAMTAKAQKVVDDVLDMALYLRNCPEDRIAHYQDAANRLAEFMPELLAASPANRGEGLPDEPDWWWRDLDPDDSGDTAHEALRNVPDLCVCLLRSSYNGPDKFAFRAPTLDPDNDDDEVLLFDTEAEALDAAKERRAALVSLRSEREG